MPASSLFRKLRGVRPRRVIDDLRKHAGGTWSYQGQGSWIGHVNGFALRVMACVQLAPRHEADEDNYHTRWHCWSEDGQRHVAASDWPDVLGKSIAAWAALGIR